MSATSDPASWATLSLEIRQQIIKELINRIVADGKECGRSPALDALTQTSFTFGQDACLQPLETTLAAIEAEHVTIEEDLKGVRMEIRPYFRISGPLHYPLR